MNATDPMGLQWEKELGIEGVWHWVPVGQEPTNPFVGDELAEGVDLPVDFPAGALDSVWHSGTYLFASKEKHAEWGRFKRAQQNLLGKLATEQADRSERQANDPSLAKNFYKNFGLSFKQHLNTPEAKWTRQAGYALWKITPGLDLVVGDIEAKLDPGEEGVSKAAAPTGMVLDMVLNPRGAIRKAITKSILGSLKRNNAALIKNLGGKLAKDYAAHHLIPVSVADKFSVMRRAAELGYDINRAGNGIALPMKVAESLEKGLPLHSGGHLQDYFNIARGKLQSLENAFKAGVLKDEKLLEEIGKVEEEMRKGLLSGEMRLQNAGWPQ